MSRGRGPISGLDGPQTQELQRILAGRGYDVGKIDGLAGAKTRTAVKDMQLKLGLPADFSIARQRAAMEAFVLEDVIKPLLAERLKGGEPLTLAEWQEALPDAKGLASVFVEMTLLKAQADNEVA